jgi:hypothetical protein
MLMESSIDDGIGAVTIDELAALSPLGVYLLMEKELNEFFSLVDFCYSGCILNEKGNFPLIHSFGNENEFIRGDVGCCLWDQFRNYTPYVTEQGMKLLEKSRLEKYGLPKNNEPPVELPFGDGYAQPCAYHTPEGCILEDHKSSICIAYICPTLYEHLSSTYQIYFERAYAGVILDRTLSGVLRPEDHNAFIEHIEMYKKRICDINSLKI